MLSKQVGATNLITYNPFNYLPTFFLLQLPRLQDLTCRDRNPWNILRAE